MRSTAGFKSHSFRRSRSSSKFDLCPPVFSASPKLTYQWLATSHAINNKLGTLTTGYGPWSLIVGKSMLLFAIFTAPNPLHSGSQTGVARISVEDMAPGHADAT